mgnify:CR=1 FL=1
MLLLKPIKIYGTWDEGIVIDYHMLKSKFLGYDENGKEKFCALTIEEEAEVLFQILKLFQCTSEMPKLEKIGGKKSMGRINRGMNITNIDNLAIIHQSVTGLYEKVERII